MIKLLIIFHILFQITICECPSQFFSKFIENDRQAYATLEKFKDEERIKKIEDHEYICFVVGQIQNYSFFEVMENNLLYKHQKIGTVTLFNRIRATQVTFCPYYYKSLIAFSLKLKEFDGKNVCLTVDKYNGNDLRLGIYDEKFYIDGFLSENERYNLETQKDYITLNSLESEIIYNDFNFEYYNIFNKN